VHGAAETRGMFHFQTLDVYQCATAFLPKAYALAALARDRELASQLRRAALSINLNIAEGTGRFDRDQRKHFVIARGSAFECAAVLDAIQLVIEDAPARALEEGRVLLHRVVSMLTKMIT
jgi:four helix bundle protein